MTAVAVGVLTSLLLEDAAAVVTETAAVEFCCDGAGAPSVLPLADWLRFFRAVCRNVTALGDVGAG